MCETSFNLRCPKGYQDIRFVVIGTTQASSAWCPISGKPNCVDCDIVENTEGARPHQVKKKESD